MRTVEIGRLVHDLRGRCAGGGQRWSRWPEKATARRVGCCPYAAADGLAAAKRLAYRGFLVRADQGFWTLPDREETP